MRRGGDRARAPAFAALRCGPPRAKRLFLAVQDVAPPPPAPRAPPFPPPAGLLTIQTGTPNLSALFSLQNVTPIHVAPAVWLGLHWRGLRGEAVAAGMFSGLAVTIGLVFSPLNTGLVKGQDSTACGLSTALIGFFVNITITVVLGLLLQKRPTLFGDVAAATASAKATLYEKLDMGPRRVRMLNAPVMLLLIMLLLLC